VLEADDEVAVTHLTAEFDFRQVTPALVDLRATVDDAVRSGSLSLDEARHLIVAAATTPFPERHPISLAEALVERAALPDRALDRWRHHLVTSGMRSVKQDDARAALRLAGRPSALWPPPLAGTSATPQSARSDDRGVPETSFLSAWRIPPTIRTAITSTQLHADGPTLVRGAALESLLEERFVGRAPEGMRAPAAVAELRERLVDEVGEPLPNRLDGRSRQSARLLAAHRPDLTGRVRPVPEHLLAAERRWTLAEQQGTIVLRRWRANMRTLWLPRVAERLVHEDLADRPVGFSLSRELGVEAQLRAQWRLAPSDPWPEALLDRGLVDNVDLARAIRQNELMIEPTTGETANV
jgi:hypothetical protein